jgi:secreted PhoX family phosphatase
MSTSTFNLYLSSLKQKGNLAFEYRPFHNYQTSEDLYIASTNVGDVIFPKGKAVNINTGEILNKKDNLWIDKFGNVINNVYDTTESSNLYAKAGSLIDLDTENLNFDLKHPVEIEV